MSETTTSPTPAAPAEVPAALPALAPAPVAPVVVPAPVAPPPAVAPVSVPPAAPVAPPTVAPPAEVPAVVPVGASDALIRQYADAELANLDTKQRNLVIRLAGTNPAEQLKQIMALKELVAALPVATPAPAPPPPLAAPVNTAPAAAPPPAVVSSTLPVKERYAAIDKISDPTRRETARTLFCLEHGSELIRTT